MLIQTFTKFIRKGAERGVSNAKRVADPAPMFRFPAGFERSLIPSTTGRSIASDSQKLLLVELCQALPRFPLYIRVHQFTLLVLAATCEPSYRRLIWRRSRNCGKAHTIFLWAVGIAPARFGAPKSIAKLALLDLDEVVATL